MLGLFYQNSDVILLEKSTESHEESIFSTLKAHRRDDRCKLLIYRRESAVNLQRMAESQNTVNCSLRAKA